MVTSAEKEKFIEECALLFEKLGSTRMAGRILGFMLISEKESVSFIELTEIIHASKSSISTNVKVLNEIGYIKMVTLPADRKTYYQLNHEISHPEMTSHRTKLLGQVAKIHERALELRENKEDMPSRWIKKTSHFYNWLLKEMPVFLARYENENPGDDTM